mmetsp:Transcript_12419/g.20476  ORF Transcript_12419/g.20476 Transcript_12419/m.20476 type:complete len:230 (+) Transcript_12419:545-1234(+)
MRSMRQRRRWWKRMKLPWRNKPRLWRRRQLQRKRRRRRQLLLVLICFRGVPPLLLLQRLLLQCRVWVRLGVNKLVVSRLFRNLLILLLHLLLRMLVVFTLLQVIDKLALGVGLVLLVVVYNNLHLLRMLVACTQQIVHNAIQVFTLHAIRVLAVCSSSPWRRLRTNIPPVWEWELLPNLSILQLSRFSSSYQQFTLLLQSRLSKSRMMLCWQRSRLEHLRIWSRHSQEK